MEMMVLYMCVAVVVREYMQLAPYICILPLPPATTNTQCKLHECKWSICASWWKENTTNGRCKGQDQH